MAKIIKWKKDVINHYRVYNDLNTTLVSTRSPWNSYNDLIQGLSFMKHELNQNQFTSADYEELISR